VKDVILKNKLSTEISENSTKEEDIIVASTYEAKAR
jgi:hypothetical protein